MFTRSEETFVSDSHLLLEAYTQQKLHQGSMNGCLAAHLLAHHAGLTVQLHDDYINHPGDMLTWRDADNHDLYQTSMDWYATLNKWRHEDRKGALSPLLAGSYTLAELSLLDIAFELGRQYWGMLPEQRPAPPDVRDCLASGLTTLAGIHKVSKRLRTEMLEVLAALPSPDDF